jgi:hypothetical protein
MTWFDLLLYVFSVVYITKVMGIKHLGIPKQSHGFIQVDEEQGVVRSFSFFDYIRVLLGHLELKDESLQIYTLKETGIAPVWTCAYCLSFWVNLGGLLLLSGFGYPVETLALLLFSVPFMAGKILEL